MPNPLMPKQEAVERERRKAAAAAAAERAAFEAREARMAAELAQRTAAERAILEEAAQRAREAAEALRRCVFMPWSHILQAYPSQLKSCLEPAQRFGFQVPGLFRDTCGPTPMLENIL